MAMALVQLAAASANSTDTTSYTGTSGAPAVGDLIIATFYVTGISNSVPTISGGGYNWKLEQTLIAGSPSNDRVFIATTQATSISAVAPAISFGATATGCIIKASRITGLEGQSQLYIRQSATASGLTANPLMTLPTTALTGNGMWGVIVNLQGTATFSAPAGWTSHFEQTLANPSVDLNVIYRVSGFTGATVSWVCNVTGVKWDAFMMELYNVGTGPIQYGGNGESGFFGLSRPY